MRCRTSGRPPPGPIKNNVLLVQHLIQQRRVQANPRRKRFLPPFGGLCKTETSSYSRILNYSRRSLLIALGPMGRSSSKDKTRHSLRPRSLVCKIGRQHSSTDSTERFRTGRRHFIRGSSGSGRQQRDARFGFPRQQTNSRPVDVVDRVGDADSKVG